VLMQTAKAEIQNPTNANTQPIRLLLDTGSQRTYITENLAEQLGLVNGDEQEIKLVTFGSKKTKVIKTPSTALKIKLNNGKHLNVHANIVPDITGTIQRKPISLQ